MNKPLWPVPDQKRISSKFGNRTNPVTGKQEMHNAIDIPATRGTDIRSIHDGVVVAVVSNNATAGNTYIVRHDEGVQKYSFGYHCDKVLVKKGDKVKRGETIAKIGNTGMSTGPHLHFGLCSQVSGSWPVRASCVDPDQYDYEFGIPVHKPEPKPQPEPKPDTNVYTVKPGDTMYRIAIQYGVTLAELVAANPQIKNANLIKVGDKINIPKAQAVKPPATPKPPAPAPKKPKAGETVTLTNAPLYASASTAKVARRLSGNFYVYDGVETNGRYRITNTAARVGKKPVWLYTTGFVNKSDL